MKKILVLILFLISAISTGRTFYLSPTGLDSNPGTSTQPFFTLNKAWTVLSAGDTLLMRGGTYQYVSSQFLTGKSGTPTNPINIWAYPGEVPVITKTSDFEYTWSSGICFTGDYFHWKGIEITGFSQQEAKIFVGLRVTGASNNVFEQINSHHNGHGCVITGKSGNNLLLNSDFHHNQDPMTTPKYEHADGLEICYIPGGLVNKIKGCRFWWNSDDGIDLWQNDGIVEIDSCWSWNNGYIPDTDIPAGNGNGFKLGITTIDHGTEVLRILRNCVAYNNRSRGFDQNNALCSITLYNNTAYRNGTNGYVLNYQAIFCTVKNCISFKNTLMPAISKSSIVEKNAFADNNLTSSDDILSDNDFISLDASQLSWTRSLDGNLPAIDFLKPATGSDLIDKGIEAGLPYWGIAPDIGAFEITEGEYHFNQLPSVRITSPTKGFSFTSPAEVSIDIEASDPDGSVVKVEIFNGNAKVGECNSAPYSFVLKELQPGSYSLIAVATDNEGAFSSSAIFDLKVNPRNEPGEFFNLYPNPNNGRFAIDFSSILEADVFTVTVVDLIGKTVYREEIPKEENTREFDLSHLYNGIYVVIISADQIILTQKFIKG